ncbi:MAG: TonB family protein, partial [Candidatus Binataceae bacterium]
MKRCPSCDKTYPDSETFCETDGTALVGADPAFVQGGTGGGSGGVECPVCGGKAEPGEIICNFCGARLSGEGAASAPPSAPVPPVTASRGPGGNRTEISSQPLSGKFTGRTPEQPPEYEDETAGAGGFLRLIAYILAALIALIGGAWLAIHLTAHHPSVGAQTSPSAIASPSPLAPEAATPMVALASSIPLQVTGESAAAPERSASVARNSFDSGKSALLDAYRHALGADPNFKDGMMVRIRILPDGTIAQASVLTSTAPNPGLDAEVAGDVTAWSFAPFSGGQVEVNYPIIFAQTPADQAAVESALSAKLAGLSPTETPEYSSATPSPAASPAATSAPAAAQTFPTPDSVLKHIWALGEDSSQAEHLSSVLFDSIGPRLTGSPDLKRGNDWLVKTYESWGIDARNEQYGTWRGWRRGYSHIDLIAPRTRSLEGTMLGYSPGTGKRDLTAPTVILPRFADSTEFVKWLPSARGKLILVA